MIDTKVFDKRTYQLYGGINKSTRYHNRRRRFYETWNAVTVALSAVSLAIASALQWQDVTNPLAAAALALMAAWGVVDAALVTTKKANLHSELATQFAMLEKRFAISRRLNDEEYKQIVDDRLDIEAREPPTLYLLNELAHMEFERSVGADDEPPPRVAFWRRATVQLLSHYNYTVRKLRPAALPSTQ